LALGFRHDLVQSELDLLQWKPRPTVVVNDRFDRGSVLTVHTVADAMTRGGDILLMDADVLYDQRIMNALIAGRAPVNRLLIDREFEAGEMNRSRSAYETGPSWNSEKRLRLT
jgi:choline kinase